MNAAAAVSSSPSITYQTLLRGYEVMRCFKLKINILFIVILLVLFFISNRILSHKKEVLLRISNENDSLYSKLLYTHPDYPTVKGRPFSGLITHGHILQKYLDHPTITLNPKHKIQPQLITALSSNHFIEHTLTVDKFLQFFPNHKPVLVYDLGLTDEEKDYFLLEKHRYRLREFDFSKYPEKFKWLKNMSWKIILMMECLMEFSACLWFDTSLVIDHSPTQLINDYIYERKSSFVYYINTAGHNVAWATHPEMFAYFPSNISRLNDVDFKMSQAGATITYNTEDLKHGIMKWAIACALTPECIMPNYELNAKRIKYGTKTNPFGNFDNHYCNKSLAPATQPFTRGV